MEKDKSPAPFASVGLVQLPDSAMISGSITLTDGSYQIENVKPGNYLIRVSFIGYKTEDKKIAVESGIKEVVADTIFLTETTTDLGEVEVVAERLKGKELVDRTVYSVPEAVAKTSNTGYDVLKKIPQVTVDFQNNITLNGSSNFIIQVDGRQRSREFLAKLVPTDIETIEIISNPSGKYEGNIDGVINIILKKEARYGLSGNTAVQTKPFNRPTNVVTGSLDYALGKLTFYVTGFVVNQKLDISTTNENRFTQIDSLTSMAGNGGIDVTLSSINGGFDYYLNAKNNLSFNVNVKPIGQNIGISSWTNLFKGNIPGNRISSVFDNNLHSDENSFSLSYQKLFKKPVQEFTVEANYYIFRSDEENDFNNTQYYRNSESVVSNYSRLEQDLNNRDYFSGKLNYVHPVGMNTKIETGYQLYYQDLSYDFTIDNPPSSNLFEYAEMRHSVYGGVTYNLKKLGIQGMLRVENSHIKADSVTQPNYSCYLPSVNLQYKFSPSQNLKFTYNRRINRPGIYDMNPYFKIGSNYEISQGNPDLRPDYRDRLQLTWTRNFGSNYLSPFVYREYYSDRVGRQIQVVTSPVTHSFTTLTKPFNLIDGYETGGGVNAMLWYVNISARIWKGHFNEYRSGPMFIPAVDYYSSSVTGYAFYQVDKKKTATVIAYLNYTGVNVNSQSKTYTHPLWGLGGQKQLKNHSFGVFWLLPFTTNLKLNRTETETTAFNSENTTSFDASNFIQFSYSYKFNRGKNVKKLGRKTEIESDSKGQTIGR
jgi:hypothetical protein